MNIREAVNAGRFHHQWLPDLLYYETGSLERSTVRELESMGHILNARPSIGRVNAIMVLPDGSFAAGADPRGENAAAGF